MYPAYCCSCENHLVENEYLLCVYCRHKLPYSGFDGSTENILKKKFYGRIPIVYACSLFLFQKKGMAQKLIHQLKYKNNQELGELLGILFGKILNNNKKMREIQCIVPVPLHPKKEKRRGYNQLTKFGEKISSELNIPFKRNFLVRINISSTQTRKDSHERWKDTLNAFSLNNQNSLKNQHILLIDDVITSGATIEACALELLKIENVKISIACIAHLE